MGGGVKLPIYRQGSSLGGRTQARDGGADPRTTWATRAGPQVVALGGSASSIVGCPSRTAGSHVTVACGGQSYDVDTSSAACMNDPHVPGVFRNADTTARTTSTCAPSF